jgi:hypothetical protein
MDFFQLRKNEQKITKKIRNVEKEIENMQGTAQIIREIRYFLRSASSARARGSFKYQEDSSNVWQSLKNWDSVPGIVQKALKDQEDQLSLKQVRSNQAKLELLQNQIQENRKKTLKIFEKQLIKERETWEAQQTSELEKIIEKHSEKFESEKNDLKMRIRVEEISLKKLESIVNIS